MEPFGRLRQKRFFLTIFDSALVRGPKTRITMSTIGLIMATCFLEVEPRALASSHNEVTGWTKLFGPYPVDRGGDISSYVNAIAAANSAEALVVIEGTCVSACTIRLAAKHRCVKPNAILWFHAAVEGSSVSPEGNALLLDSYPPRVRQEVLRRGMLEDVALNPEHTLTGGELINLGERTCR